MQRSEKGHKPTVLNTKPKTPHSDLIDKLSESKVTNFFLFHSIWDDLRNVDGWKANPLLKGSFTLGIVAGSSLMQAGSNLMFLRYTRGANGKTQRKIHYHNLIDSIFMLPPALVMTLVGLPLTGVGLLTGAMVEAAVQSQRAVAKQAETNKQMKTSTQAKLMKQMGHQSELTKETVADIVLPKTTDAAIAAPVSEHSMEPAWQAQACAMRLGK